MEIKIDPRIPIAWDGFKSTYHYGKAVYNIEVVKKDKTAITLDGNEISSTSISLQDDGKVHKVVVATHK